jgi:hypothetical protein
VERKPISDRFPEVDYNKCKRYGPSYRALPKNVRTARGRPCERAGGRTYARAGVSTGLHVSG